MEKNKKNHQEEQLSNSRLRMTLNSFIVRNSPWVMKLIWLLKGRCKNPACVTQPAAKQQYINRLAHESLQRHACMHTHLLYSLHGRWWILVAAQVNNNPGNIAEEGDGD